MNSITLTKLLSDRKTNVCGTLQANGRGVSKDVSIKTEKEKYILKWNDEKERKKVSMKPNIIHDYNLGMSSIDKAD